MRIEQSYGGTVPKEARREIVEITNRFLIALAAAERDAPPVKDVKERIERIKRAAQTLLSALKTTGDGAQLAHDVIEQKFGDLARLDGTVTVLEVACDQAIGDLESATPHFRGRAWDYWVRDLTNIAITHKLPTGVRKDVYRKAADSQFVRLVQALQSLVPESERRHVHSLDALAKAISLARRRRRDR